MNESTSANGPILRIFEARAKPGRADALVAKFATTSADVVRNEPGNDGYVFGRCVQPGDDADTVVFISVWADLDAVRRRFGADWERSFLPPGYDDLIESRSLRHVDAGAGGGWHIEPGQRS